MPAQMPDIAWGVNNDGPEAIIAKDGFNDGTNLGLDVRNMQYIHFDIWSSVATTYPELRLNDTPAGNIVLDDSGWQSFDLDITSLTDAQKSNIRWIKFIAFRDPAPEDIVIDNVYFWSYGVTSNVDGWSTFACAEPMKVPEGVTVYSASYSKTATEEILTLTDAGDVIPANTGVLLKGADNNTPYIFAPATNAEAETAEANFADNCLVGCAVRTDISAVAADHDIFCLRRSDLYEMSGFFLYSGQYIPAGKAYLALSKPSQPSSAPRKVRFVINEDKMTTGIENAHTDSLNAVKFIENGQLFIRRGEAVYNLQGVRVK